MNSVRVRGALLPAVPLAGARGARSRQKGWTLRRDDGRARLLTGGLRSLAAAPLFAVRAGARDQKDLPPGVVGARGKVTRSGLDKLTMTQLRDLCASMDLSCEGKKLVLVDRLFTSLSAAILQPSEGEKVAKAAPPPTAREQPTQKVAPQAVRSSRQEARAAKPASAAAKGARRHQRQYGTAEQRADGSEQSTGLAVTWLGSSSGAPTQARNVSCTAVELGPAGVVLVDCGEGAKRQLARSHIDPLDIRCICITHMHGDHCFGIPGVLNSLSHHKHGKPEEEAKPVVIYGPPGTFSWVDTAIQASAIHLCMRVLVVELHKAQEYAHKPQQMDQSGKLWLSKAVPTPKSASQAKETIHRNQSAGGEAARQEEQRLKAGVINGLTWNLQIAQGYHLQSAQLLHRVPCFGFCFTESRLMVPVEESGSTIMGDAQGFEASIPGRKVLILGDTCDSASISNVAMQADLVSHEATFSDGMEQKAAIACHSTARMAGVFAKSISASNLFLTHFSPRFQIGASGKEGKADAEDKLSSSDVNDITSGDISAIVGQAKQAFGSDRVFPVKDFLTVHVPAKQPQVRRLSSRQLDAGHVSG